LTAADEIFPPCGSREDVDVAAKGDQGFADLHAVDEGGRTNSAFGRGEVGDGRIA
jgi:hypothetical protein